MNRLCAFLGHVPQLYRRFFFSRMRGNKDAVNKRAQNAMPAKRARTHVLWSLHCTAAKEARINAAAQMNGWTPNSRDLGCETTGKKPPTMGDVLRKQQVGSCTGTDTG
jgi:hypothetical protein